VLAVVGDPASGWRKSSRGRRPPRYWPSGSAHAGIGHHTTKRLIPGDQVSDGSLATPERWLLKRILSVLVPEAQQAVLQHQADNIANRIKDLPPTISATEVRARLQSALASEMSWEEGHDALLRTQLSETASALDRMRRLKRGGVSFLPPGIAVPTRELLADLARVGLFLVPVGELEEWLAGQRIVASRTNKWAWANEAASVVRRVGAQPADIWAFMREVGHFLLSSLSGEAPSVYTELASPLKGGVSLAAVHDS